MCGYRCRVVCETERHVFIVFVGLALAVAAVAAVAHGVAAPNWLSLCVRMRVRSRTAWPQMCRKTDAAWQDGPYDGPRD